MAQYSRSMQRTFDGFDFKERLRWGFLLSVLISTLASLHPTSSYLESHSSSFRVRLATNNDFKQSRFVTARTFAPEPQVLTLSLRGGTEEMGLNVQNQGPIDVQAVIPALMSTDNSVRSQAEVHFSSSYFNSCATTQVSSA